MVGSIPPSVVRQRVHLVMLSMTDRKDGHSINPSHSSSGFFIGQTMWQQLIDTFKKPPAKVIAQREFEESQRQFLIHESTAAYHSKIAEYYSANISRLNTYIKKA